NRQSAIGNRKSQRMDYVQITKSHREQMLKAVGAGSIADLLKQVPDEFRLEEALKLPPSLDELSLRNHLSQLAARNAPADEKVCFLGAGVYDHFIPAVVDFLAMKGEFLTAYTPYQAEASQGSLQAFFEFQTMVCQLTGMEVANASLYEGATALAEAAMMALNLSGKREIIVSEGVHPHYRQVLKTYLADLPAIYTQMPLKNGVVDTQELESELETDTAAVIVQSPNFLGNIERVDTITKFAHANQSLMIQSFNPLSLGILKHPGEMGVDIATAEGQPLGIPLQFGGPYLGLFATRLAHVRKMPGRLVGQTVDAEGRRAFCLTLQTREQHIRREKATSNVCTNQGLLALRASVYMAAMGPAGIRQAAQLCHNKTSYLVDRLKDTGIRRRFEQPFFNEVVVQLERPVDEVLEEASRAGILAGYAIGKDYPDLVDCLLIAVTEKRSREEIDRLVEVLSGKRAKSPKMVASVR
ncbi:MAG TPA: aminomethyl-transferring glycine dehydrogenase subunit GcvPA, partial [Tepidisphaeraceae bacterium]|nr:aminomethyl-transferring glycine dehydrogenase subunit GcvPA [Tepidisphaeraceae bacterium]